MAVAQQNDPKILKRVRDFLLRDCDDLTETVKETFNELKGPLRALGINSIRSLDAFLGDYQELFVMNDFKSTTYVSLTTLLTVCPTHSKKAGSCSAYGCLDLHICVFYLLSGICDFGDKCFFGHSLFTSHNVNLLKQYSLADLDIEDIRAIFQLPYVRQGVTRPQVCRYYNSPQDCGRDVGSRYSCKALHLCRHYVLNDCRYGIECRLNHDVTNDDQVLEILELYGVSTKRKPKDILEDLFVYLGDGLDSDDIRARVHAAWLDRVCSRGPQPQLVRLSSVSNLRSGAHSGGGLSQLQPPTTGRICTFFLKGRCKFGSACRNRHEHPSTQQPSRDVSRPTVPLVSQRSLDELLSDFLSLTRESTADKTSAIGSNIPLHWSDMKGKELLVVQLSPSDPRTAEEYRKVERAFLKDMPRAKVKDIKRIQNRTMWDAFHVQEQSMERKYGAGKANLQNLFHGTPYHAVEPIVHQNIDPLLAGSNVGARYGRGAYFAADSAFSDSYTSESPNGYRYMFYARVLAGYVARGEGGMQRPPPRSSNDPNSLYDCVVDDVIRPRIYVIFRNQQIYPEYLIQYLRQ